MNLKEIPFLEIDTIGHAIRKNDAENGVSYITSNTALISGPVRITERLSKWAEEQPETVFLGQRDATGQWNTVRYAEAFAKVQALAQFLLHSGVSANKPLVILSGNSIAHGLIGLAALHIGVPYSPISTSYSTKSTDFAKLKHCIDLLTPSLIFVEDGMAFEEAIKAAANGVRIVAVENVQEGQVSFKAILKTPISTAVAKAYEKVNASTIAKILFTSGSTGLPKGVINTHGNITTNWQQITQTFTFLSNKEAGLTLIDWLPWNHVFGGNHNFGIALYNGGSLYIDEGDPTIHGIKATLKNLAEIAPTIYFNVPKGYEELVNHLKADKELCQVFFSRLKMFFYAGASLPQHIWDGLEQLSYETIGKRILIATGFGMTEGSPSCLFNTRPGGCSGQIGVPVPGLEVKLVPDGNKVEARYKGGNLTPGYWRNEEATKVAFDEEGYFKSGDALKWIDKNDLNKGMLFDGRIAEEFKLTTGTWVSVGVLKNRLISVANGLLQDAVITGHDRPFLGAIVFPDLHYCRRLTQLPETASLKEMVRHPKMVTALQETLHQLGKVSTGSSMCIKRAVFADFELSIDKGEITDKGSINQRAILNSKQDLVAMLYEENPSSRIVEFTGE